ncbi:MAG: hypothetical protein ACODAQ_07765 [Phycisphaeraceae bacterium]
MRMTALIQRHWWNLARFGFTPAKLAVRWSAREAPRVVSLSVPKAGTHLLERALVLHPRLHRAVRRTLQDIDPARWAELDALLARLRPGQVVMGHLGYTPRRRRAIERAGVKGLFLIRDPRDLPVSDAFYIARRRRHFRHHLFAGKPLRERIRLAIEGDARHGMPDIGARLARYAGWLEAGFELVRFEDLIGPRGGGSSERQHRQLRAIYRHLGLETDEPWISHVAERLFCHHSPTFRRGAVGQWRAYFDDELKARFNAVAADQLARYGYEPE